MPPSANWKTNIFVSPSRTTAACRFSTRMPGRRFSGAAREGRAPSCWTTPATPGATACAPTPRKSAHSATRASGCLRMARCAPRYACARATARPRLQTDWLLYAGARTLEARVALDWHEHLKILKFSFPVDVQDPRPTYEIAYGYKVRKAERRRRSRAALDRPFRPSARQASMGSPSSTTPSTATACRTTICASPSCAALSTRNTSPAS